MLLIYPDEMRDDIYVLTLFLIKKSNTFTTELCDSIIIIK